MHKHQSHMRADTYNGHLRRRSCQRKGAHDRLYFKSSNAQDYVPQNLGSLNRILIYSKPPFGANRCQLWLYNLGINVLKHKQITY